MSVIYLDNAATSWPKPEAVYDAVDRYQRECGAPLGRGSSRGGVSVEQAVRQLRDRLARLLGAPDADHVVLTFNGTDSLNLALHGLLEPGDRVVTTDIEHNSVLRPLHALQTTRQVVVERMPVDADGAIDPDRLRKALRQPARLVVFSHVSNVLGTIQDVPTLTGIARQAGALTLVDAAQSAGHLPISMQSWQVDLLATSGHKGLLGPLGTGVLCLNRGIESRLRPVRQGGTGTSSEEDAQPTALPGRFESGNHNVPGLIGLAAAVEWISERGVASLRAHELEISQRLRDGLAQVPGVTLYGPADSQSRTAILSVTIDGYAPHEAAMLLEEHFGIVTRAGLHCSPRMHASLGTLNRGGTLRFSPGAFTTPDQCDRAIEAVTQLAQGTS